MLYYSLVTHPLIPVLDTRVSVSQACWMRRKYVPLYIKALQKQQMGGDEETRSMDAQLPETTILLFRRLAHAQVGLGEWARV